MKFVVLGSTSRTGLCLLTEAERRGHRIVAFTRRPHVLPDSPALADVVTGDGRDPGVVSPHLPGADAVISLLPGGDRRDPHLAAESVRTLTAAMPEAGVRRLVVVSAYPIVGDRPRLPLWILRRVFATPYADVAAMEGIVSATDLDWTVVRLNRLNDGPAIGSLTTSPGLLAAPRSHTRADAAALLLDLAESSRHTGTALNVSG
jgi:uncharacterized protein YbjT (DUF2867 family)